MLLDKVLQEVVSLLDDQPEGSLCHSFWARSVTPALSVRSMPAKQQPSVRAVGVHRTFGSGRRPNSRDLGAADAPDALKELTKRRKPSPLCKCEHHGCKRLIEDMSIQQALVS